MFNPSFIDRITHVYMGAWQAAAAFVLSVCAFYLLRKKHRAFAVGSIKIALIIGVFAAVMQLVTGDFSAKTLADTQPAKLAALEGHYPAYAPAGAYILGWVDEEGGKVHGIEVPGMLSWMLYGDTEKPVVGLEAFAEEDRPPVNVTFQAYHLMVSIGMALIAIMLFAVFGWWRGTLWDLRWFLWILVFTVLLPQLGNQLGWITAEVGRQPWIVYGLLRTKDAVSVSVGAGQVWGSLFLFGFIYLLLGVLFVYLLNEKIKAGPDPHDKPSDTEPAAATEGPRA